jgi:hypothetical protein
MCIQQRVRHPARATHISPSSSYPIRARYRCIFAAEIYFANLGRILARNCFRLHFEGHMVGFGRLHAVIGMDVERIIPGRIIYLLEILQAQAVLFHERRSIADVGWHKLASCKGVRLSAKTTPSEEMHLSSQPRQTLKPPLNSQSRQTQKYP